MQISAALIALVFLLCSFVYAAFVEKGVSSSLLALWAIGVAIIGSGVSIG